MSCVAPWRQFLCRCCVPHRLALQVVRLSAQQAVSEHEWLPCSADNDRKQDAYQQICDSVQYSYCACVEQPPDTTDSHCCSCPMCWFHLTVLVCWTIRICIGSHSTVQHHGVASSCAKGTVMGHVPIGHWWSRHKESESLEQGASSQESAVPESR